MFDHVIKIAFVVDDIAKAVEFYTTTLDLEVEARYPSGEGEGEYFVFFEPKTVFVELLPKKAMGDATLGFHHLAFKVDSVERRLAELKEHGANVAAEAFAWRRECAL